MIGNTHALGRVWRSKEGMAGFQWPPLPPFTANYICNTNTGLRVQGYTKLTLPIEVRCGTVVRRATPSSLRQTGVEGVALQTTVPLRTSMGNRFF